MNIAIFKWLTRTYSQTLSGYVVKVVCHLIYT